MTASLLIPPVARFFDASGNPLAGGKVYTYEAGTLTPKATYTDFTAGTPNANPVILDAAGEADIWLDGNYKINVTDANDVQQGNFPVDNVSSFSTGSLSEYAVTTGSANTYVLTSSPAITAYTAGLVFNIKINVSNTGPSTINISGLGAASLVKGASTALASGDLVQDRVYQIVYDGTNFQVTPTGSMAWQYATGITVDEADIDNVNINGNTITASSGSLLITNLANPTNAQDAATKTYTDNIIQIVNTTTGAVATGTTQIPNDDSIPQNTEGNEYMTLAITPVSATSKLKIDVVFNYAQTGVTTISAAALFQDSTANALAVASSVNSTASTLHQICFTHYMTSGTTSETTFKVRGGPASVETMTFNGVTGSRKYGGVLSSSITITEYNA